MSGIVTLTTDFSTSDAYVGMMKGAILSVDPGIVIVDLAHDIHPHDVAEAAFILETTYSYFPEGTVHLVVVDPGVGSVRRRVAMKCGGHYFVGPDNGVFTYPIRRIAQYEAVEIEPFEERVGLHGVTFEGRDVFGPTAARLAGGTALSDIGTAVTDLKELDIPRPKISESSIVGKIVYIDHFGNCVSNIEAAEIEKLEGTLSVAVGGRDVGDLVRSYSEARVGEPLAIINSLDHLEIAINQGNAAEDLNIMAGSSVRVMLTR